MVGMERRAVSATHCRGASCCAFTHPLTHSLTEATGGAVLETNVELERALRDGVHMHRRTVVDVGGSDGVVPTNSTNVALSLIHI